MMARFRPEWEILRPPWLTTSGLPNSPWKRSISFWPHRPEGILRRLRFTLHRAAARWRTDGEPRRRLYSSVNAPKHHRILVLHIQPISRSDWIGIRIAVRHFVAGQLLEFFVVRFDNGQLSGWRKRQQHRAGVHHAAEAAAATTRRAPGALAVFRIDAKPIVAASEAVEHPLLQHRRIELHGVVSIAPQFLRFERIAVLLNLQRFGAAARPYPQSMFPNWWESHGARSCGYPLTAGLITVEEMQAGRIEHALVFAYPGLRSRYFQPPAS